MTIIYGKSWAEDSCPRCYDTPPEWEEPCCFDPCDPCEPKCCPPKTCAKDMIKIEHGEVGRIFHIKQVGCNGRPIPMIRDCIRMDIRRKGRCKVLVKLFPFRAVDASGLEFKWGPYFLSLPAGYYEGDIYINNEECQTVLLFLPGCERTIANSEAVIDDDEYERCTRCGGHNGSCGCGESCCAVPMYDEEISPAESVGCERGCGHDQCR